MPSTFARYDISCPYRDRARQLLRKPRAGGASALHRDGSAFSGAAGLVVHGNVEVDVAVRGFEAEDRGFGIVAGFGALFLGQQSGRENLECEATIVELRYGIADHHVR